MGVVRSAFLVSAALAAPTTVLTPPLRSGPSDETVAYEVKVLSQLATSGYYLYNRRCWVCHGPGAAGGHAPSLVQRRFWHDKYPRQEFHTAVRRHGADQHDMTGDRSATVPSFNEIEQIARYLREVQQPGLYR